jgi:putative ABC transport system permease protein
MPQAFGRQVGAMSLALSTVVYEWRRYLAAVVALAFSGLLILAQVGMFVGIGKAFTATIDRSRADIFVLSPKSDSLLNTTGMPSRLKPLVYLDPDVTEVTDLAQNGGLFSNLDKGSEKKRNYVNVSAVDVAPGALGLPTDFDEVTRQAIAEPYAVAIDRSALNTLGVKLGDTAALGGHSVKVAAVLTNYPNLVQPTVMVSRQTLQLMGMARPSNRVGPMMVRIRDPRSADAVRDRLNAIGKGQFRAWTKAELSAANDAGFIKQQFIGIILGFSVILGFGIGVGITSQTLRGAVLGNIKEFASLRALGVSMGSLRAIVMELSFWVGVAGLGLTGVLVMGVAALASSGGVPMSFPPFALISVAILLLAIAVFSGFLAMGVLKKSQPADLLR